MTVVCTGANDCVLFGAGDKPFLMGDGGLYRC